MARLVTGKGQLHKVFASVDEPIAISLQFDDAADARVAKRALGEEWSRSGAALVWYGDYDGLQERISQALGVPSEKIEPARHTAALGPMFEVAIAMK
jgi:hypothetical protein